MFCTNCGEEMRATDKFCANCGTAAAPRPAKTREVASLPTEPPAPVRAAQSTAEAFHAPLPATSTSAASVRQPVPPAPPPLSRQQEEQVLLEAEEIASCGACCRSTHCQKTSHWRRLRHAGAAGWICPSCGDLNPASNRFCERCGSRRKARLSSIPWCLRRSVCLSAASCNPVG